MRCLRLLPPALTPEDEPGFLEAAQRLVRATLAGERGEYGRGDSAGQECDDEGGRHVDMCELLAKLLWRYFEQSRRFEVRSISSTL